MNKFLTFLWKTLSLIVSMTRSPPPPSFNCRHRWSAPRTLYWNDPSSGRCQSAGSPPRIYPDRPAPALDGQSGGPTGSLGAGKRSFSGRIRPSLHAPLTGKPPTQSGWTYRQTRSRKWGSDGRGGGRRWVGRWRTDRAADPNDPSKSPTRSGAGPDRRTQCRGRRSLLHPPGVAATGWWRVASSMSGLGVGLPQRWDWTGWPPLASVDVRSWLRKRLKWEENLQNVVSILWGSLLFEMEHMQKESYGIQNGERWKGGKWFYSFPPFPSEIHSVNSILFNQFIPFIPFINSNSVAHQSWTSPHVAGKNEWNTSTMLFCLYIRESKAWKNSEDQWCFIMVIMANKIIIDLWMNQHDKQG